METIQNEKCCSSKTTKFEMLNENYSEISKISVYNRQQEFKKKF